MLAMKGHLTAAAIELDMHGGLGHGSWIKGPIECDWAAAKKKKKKKFVTAAQTDDAGKVLTREERNRMNLKLRRIPDLFIFALQRMKVMALRYY